MDWNCNDESHYTSRCPDCRRVFCEDCSMDCACGDLDGYGDVEGDAEYFGGEGV